MSNNLAVLRVIDTPEHRAMMREVYLALSAEGTADIVFYDGFVSNAEEFERFVFREGTLLLMVFDDAGPAAASWFNGWEGRSCRGHFAAFRRVWGRRNTMAIARTVFEYVLGLHDEHGFLFDVLIGICPENNALVWKLGELCGAQRQGLLPYFIRKADGSSENAVLYTVTRDDIRR